MRVFLTGLGLLALAAGFAPPAGAADRGAPSSCLSSGDTFEAVADREVVPPREAIGLARKAVPNAEVLRTALCRDRDRLVYLATLLQKGGRLVRVSIDAHTAAVTLN